MTDVGSYVTLRCANVWWLFSKRIAILIIVRCFRYFIYKSLNSLGFVSVSRMRNAITCHQTQAIITLLTFVEIQLMILLSIEAACNYVQEVDQVSVQKIADAGLEKMVLVKMFH